jgi:tetratricopeptide (TPR) repeat protein
MKLKSVIFISLAAVLLLVLNTLFWAKKSAEHYLQKAQKTVDPQVKIKLLTKAVSFDNALQDAYLQRAKAYLDLVNRKFADIFMFLYGSELSSEQENNLAKAVVDLENVSYDKKYFEMGQVYFFMRDYKKADEEFARALEEKPSDYDINMFDALTDIGLGNFDEAITALNETVRLNPDKSQPYLIVARLYSQKQEYGAAVGNYRKAFDYSNDNLKILKSLITAFISVKDWNYAQKTLDKLKTIPDMKASVNIFYAAYHWNKNADKEMMFAYLNKAKQYDAQELRDPYFFPIWFFRDLKDDTDFKKYIPFQAVSDIIK